MTGADLPPPPPGSTPDGTPPGTLAEPAASPVPPPPDLQAPSGYVGYTAAQGMRSQLRPIRSNARMAMILAAVTGVGSLVSAFITANIANKAQEYLDGDITEDAFLDANNLAPFGQILSAAPTVAAGVFAMLWMFKMSKNLRTLGRTTTFAPLLAVLGWFLPPFLFVIPLLVLRELWKASDPSTPPGADGWRSSGENPVLYAWFIAYGVIPAVLTFVTVSSVLDATLNLDTDTDSIAEAASATGAPVVILGGVVTLIAAGIWMLAVKQLTERHIAFTGEM